MGLRLLLSPRSRSSLMRPRTAACATVLALVLAVAGSPGPVASADDGAWPNSQLIGGAAVLGGDGQGHLTAAGWYRNSSASGTSSYVVLQSSHDNAPTLGAPEQPPLTDPGPLRMAAVAVNAGDTYLVAERRLAGDRTTVRLDHLDASGWHAPVVLDDGCGNPLQAATVAAAHGTTVVVVDPCATAWLSTDGGTTFTPHVVSPDPWTVRFDPQALTWNGSGFSLLANGTINTDELWSTTSADGATWTPGVQIPLQGQSIDARTLSARDGTSGLLVAATCVNTHWSDPDLARLRIETRTSADGGLTWSAPTVRYDGPANSAGRYGAPPLLAWTTSGFDLTTLVNDAASPRWARWGSSDGQTWQELTPPPAVTPTGGAPMLASVVGGAHVNLVRNGFYDRSPGPGPDPDPSPSAPTTQAPSVATLYGLTPSTAVTVAGRGRGYRLSAGGVPSGTTVQLWGRTRGTTTWQLLRTTTSGGFVVVAPTASTDLQARVPASTTVLPSSSAVQRALVAPAVHASLSASSVSRRGTATLRASVLPAHPGSTLLLQRQVANGWQTVASQPLDARSTTTFRLPTATSGRQTYRAVLPAHVDHSLGASTPQPLDVR